LGLVEAAEKFTHLISYKGDNDALNSQLNRDLRDAGQLHHVLRLAGRVSRASNSKIPSWMVDWTFGSHYSALSRRGIPVSMSYTASACPPSVRKGAIDDEIFVKGKGIGIIQGLSTVELPSKLSPKDFFNTPESFESVISYLEEVRLLSNHISDPYSPTSFMNEPLSEAVSRTLIADKADYQRPAPDKYKDYLAKILYLFQAMKARYDMDNRDQITWSGSALREWFNSPAELTESLNLLAGGDEAWFDGPGTWRFCTTDTGLIGLVPWAVEIGDVVCVVAGVEVPLIMKRSFDPARYQLVGGGYIHGMMDGEEVEVDAWVTEFILC
jgi:hypothetical protein